MKFILTLILTCSLLPAVISQEPLKYQLPPAEIIQIVDAPVTPVISVSPDRMNILIIQPSPIISIKELSAEELRIGGLRINPLNNGTGRQTYNKGYRLMKPYYI